MCRNIKLRMSDEEKLTLINTNLFGEELDIKIIQPLLEENNNADISVTFKDVANIMYSMMGQGVTWQLANEISKEFNLDLIKVTNFLDNLVEDYASISDEEASIRWDNIPKYEDVYKLECTEE